MTVVKYVLVGIYLLICVCLIITTTLQNKESQNDASDTYENTDSSNKFFEKNKGRTKQGKANKRTIFLGVSFVILSIVTSTVLMLF